MKSPTIPQSLRLSELNPAHNLADALARMETQVRQAPTSSAHRWALAELLCVLGQWGRALQQLQAGARLASQQADWRAKAHMLRGLIRAEAMRTEVFAGRQLPVPVMDRPQWMEEMAQAIAANVSGDHARADMLRRSALDAAPVCSGVCSQSQSAARGDPSDASLVDTPFGWIADSDTRLGPVCELMVAGAYRWLAFADVEEITIERPDTLLDLVWLPATLRLCGTSGGPQTLHAFIPTRYTGVEELAAQAFSGQRDALMLSHLTRWHDTGDTGVFAQGQKMLMTPGGDVPLLEVRSLRMEVSA